MNLKFTKMEALGNDYVYVDLLENKDLDIENIKKNTARISNRHNGVGGDGVILIGVDEVATSGPSGAKIWTRIFNADGSEAEMCGNGLRCVAKIVFDNGYTEGKNHFDILLKKPNRKVHAIVNKDVTIDMGEAVVGAEAHIDLKNESVRYVSVNIGNPHAVVFRSHLNQFNIEAIGGFIEKHQNFPNKTNVEFVEVLSKNKIRLRVWERGVGETMACGSGACASVAAAISKGLCDNKVEVNMPGGTATVSMVEKSMHLTGSVTYVFKGEYILKRP